MTDGEKRLGPAGELIGLMPDLPLIPDAATYFYIKRIKKWMECPVCGERLLFDDALEAWRCESCDFLLPEQEFLDGYVFWFCDECGLFLNVQEGFDKSADQWTCTECGHVNSLGEDDLVGTCQDCGCFLPDPDATLCEECEHKRLGIGHPYP